MTCSSTVPSLQARKEDGSLYTRRPEIEQILSDLNSVPIEEIARRATILDAEDPEFLPPEVLVHFLRRSKNVGDAQPYCSIFDSLRQQLLHRLPVRTTRKTGGQVKEERRQSDVRQQVLDRVTEILCADRNGYDVRLDYYEINFNGAVARARSSAWRDQSKTAKSQKTRSLEATLASGESDLEATLRSVRGVSENFSDVLYRSEVISAINSLPNEEREVILMLIHGFTIKEIADAVGCTEKTASARRNRAREKLGAELNLETGS